MEPQKIKLNLGFANLVVEVYNSDYPVPEVCICLETESVIQDIAIIRQATNSKYQPREAIECLVYSDKNDEDYTHKFTIEQYKCEE